MNYEEFILNKIEVQQETNGIEVADSDLHPMLFPHQRDTVRWMLARGRALNASSFGLGKTRISNG